MADPVLDNITEVKISTPDKSPPQENSSNTDQDTDKKIPIPLRERAYALLLQDNNTNVYLTSDNYMAYCAIEDQCMVHIAVDSISRDEVEDPVRHCFNINLDGTTIEYCLSADLIPFYISSNPESGVISDNDNNSVESDSDNVDDIDHNNDDDGDCDDETLIGAEFEIVDSDSENNDSWLNDQCIIEKYGENNIGVVEQTVPDINQEESNSSDYDTDASDSSNTSVKTCTRTINFVIDPFQESLDTENNINKCQDIVDEIMSVEVEQTDNTAENLDLHIDTVISDQLISKTENKNGSDTMKVTEELTLKMKTEYNDNISIEKENYYEKEPGNNNYCWYNNICIESWRVVFFFEYSWNRNILSINKQQFFFFCKFNIVFLVNIQFSKLFSHFTI